MMLKTRANLLAVFALFGAFYLAVGTTLAIAAEAPPRLEKVRISDDGRRFVLAESGRVFTPWGFNYLGEFGKLVEDSWDTDWPRIERDFGEMRKLGANTVRVHLQFGTFMKGPDTFDPAQLERLKKLLDLARETGLYLDITGLCCYRLDDIPAWYDELDEAKRWDVQAQWWRTIAKACAGHPAVFCYDLMNEPIIGGPAKEGEPRWVGGELGGFYFVQRISEDAQGRTNLQIAAGWSKKLTEAIRREDPHTPITVGVIPWAQIWPRAKPVFYSPEAAKHFDFVSIHVYPERDKVAQAVATLAVYDIGKPLVVEETFPLACSIEEMDAFLDGGKDRVDGWISHYFGHTIEEHERGAEPKGTAPDAPFRVTVADFLRFWRDKGKSMVETPPPKPAGENDPPPGAAADTFPQNSARPVIRGSVEQIHIVHARPRSRISVRGPRGFAATAIADDRGGLVLRDVPPGDGYRVGIEGVDGNCRTVRVLSRTEHPDASFYTSQKLDPTRGYLATRDGTLLSYRVILPDPKVHGRGPYDLVMTYSGYQPGLATGDAAPVQDQATFTSKALESQVVMAGSGSVDLWLAAEAEDVDLQVTLSEVRPDRHEMLVQSGWLRASHRALDNTASTPLRPRHPHSAEAIEKLAPKRWTLLRIELFPFAHVFREGSRIRLSVSGPGGGGNTWPWAFESMPGGFPVRIAHDGAHHSSSVVLPIVTPGDLNLPASLPQHDRVWLQPSRLVDTRQKR